MALSVVLTGREREEVERIAQQLFHADMNHMWRLLDQTAQNRYRSMAEAIVRDRDRNEKQA